MNKRKVKVVGINQYREDCPYDALTVGKTYDAIDTGDGYFSITYDDEGDYLCCCFDDCLHGYDYEWETPNEQPRED